MNSLNYDQFAELQIAELFTLEGGKLETVSDWLLMGGGICACFVNPWLGLTITIIGSVM